MQGGKAPFHPGSALTAPATSSHMAHQAPRPEKRCNVRRTQVLREDGVALGTTTALSVLRVKEPDWKAAAETAASTPPLGRDAKPTKSQRWGRLPLVAPLPPSKLPVHWGVGCRDRDNTTQV